MEHTIHVQKEDMIFNVLSIGEVKIGETASATITGKEPNQVLNLTLPKGDTGAIGATGAKGDKGDVPIKGTDYWTNTDKQEIVSDVLNEIDIPTKTSDLTNDSGFITNAVNDLVNYYLKDNTYSKTEVNALVNNITKVTISIVDTLPTTGESNIIYFVPKTGSTNDVYDEYVWISNAWEHIGSTDVDLTGYATENWVNTQIANFLTGAQVNALITNALASYALKNELPTKNSQLQNDSSFITNTVNDLINYYNIGNSYNKSEINELIAGLGSGEKYINKESDTIYLNDFAPGFYRADKQYTLRINNDTNAKSFLLIQNDILIIMGIYSDHKSWICSCTRVYGGDQFLYIGNKSGDYFNYYWLDRIGKTSQKPQGFEIITSNNIKDYVSNSGLPTFTLDGTTLNITTTNEV